MRSMRRIAGLVAPVTMLVLGLPTMVSAADAPADHIFVNAADIKWMAAPPNLPKGAKLAVLYGDPGKSGPFVIRLMTPANYKIAPHWHSQAENLSIISGALYLGEGDKMDTAKAHALKAGGFHFLPGKVHHYGFTKAATIVQIHGEGPFDITYVNAADDPGKAAKK